MGGGEQLEAETQPTAGLRASTDVAAQAAAQLDADGDGRIDEEEIVSAFARYFTVPE
ncbi:hypothetical protein SALBM217S_07762 [Streptomyces griseoloalbus]